MTTRPATRTQGSVGVGSEFANTPIVTAARSAIPATAELTARPPVDRVGATGTRSVRCARRVLAAAATTLTLVAGCGQSPTEELEREMAARPAMEQMLDHYEAMRREMIDALDREIGGLHWYAAPDLLRMRRANCTGGALENAQEVHPVGLTADGTYDHADRDAVVDIIRAIADEYGFETQGYLIDRAEDMTYIGEDRYGATFSLDMGRNSVLALRTGCHLWEHKPGPEYTRRSPLDEPSPTQTPGTSTSPPA